MHLSLASTPHLRAPDGAAVPLAPRDAALLAWLALEGPTSRNRLAALLWPESAAEAARNALRQRLFQLKKQFGDALLSGQATVALAADVMHDLHDADDVLGGQPLEIGGEFAAWLAQQRERRRHRVRDSLVELADMAEAARDHADALAHARELLALEPLSEDAHRRVMRLHYLAGDRAAALLAFDACERMLKDEVGARPSAETLALLRLIEDAHVAAPVQFTATAAALRRPPAAVGRAAQHQALLDAWQAGTNLLLLGEPGIGKSRLLDGLVEAWPGALVVRARPGDAGVPLALLARLLRELCARHPAWLHLPGVSALQSMLTAPPADPSVTIRPTPRPLLPLWLDLLGAAGQVTPPLALLIDDWQFADNASVELLAELFDAPALAGLRWGVASRTGAGATADERIAALRTHGAWRALSLGPLGSDDITRLLALLDLPAADVPGLAEALARRVGGNPLYLLEALRQMLQAHVPLQAHHVAAPSQVKELVAERLAQLPAAARQLLQVAAVAGSDFGVELAEAVTGRNALELAEAWEQLERQGLFGAHGTAHDVHAEVALAHLPAPIARLLHARVAAWLEGQPHEPARLAEHWHAAGNDERAVPHWLAAARRAWHAARAAETFEFFAQAARWHSLRGETDAAFDLWFENADAITEIGSPSLAAQCLQAMEPLARDEHQQLRVRFVRAVLRTSQGDADAGLREVMALMGDAIALGDVRVESECRFAAASRAAADGHFDEALQHLAAGERLLRDAGDPRRAAALAASMAMVLGLRGQPRLALREQQRMLPLLEQQKDLPTWVVLCSSQALQHVRAGDADAALREAQRVRSALRETSIAPPDTALTLRNLVDALRWAGQLGEALAVCEEITARLAPHGDFPVARRSEAALYLHLGRADLAHRLLSSATAGATVRQRERLHLGLLRVQSALSMVDPSAAHGVEWPAEALALDDLALAAEWALWSGLVEPAPWPLDDVRAIARRCRQSGLVLMAAPLDALVAWRSRQAGEPAPLAPTLPTGLHAAAPWAALFAARALQADDELDAARRAARHGMQWLQAVAAGALSEPFRDSFLQRHPAHRELLALAARLGA